MTTLRILLFSILAALTLYIPFYYYAPIYRTFYTHVPALEIDVNWWIRWGFYGEHGGAQIYIAYVLMYLAVLLTAFFDLIYLRFIPLRARWVAWVICVTGCFFYLRSIGFYPPMADIRADGQGLFFIAAAVLTAFTGGYFFEHKVVKRSFLFLLVCICLVPQSWSNMTSDYFYILYPALRTIKGYALNQSYFQYDHLISSLGMAWMKLGLPIDRFFIIGNFSFLALFLGGYSLARNLFIDKRLAFYFIFSLVLIKVYGNIGVITTAPQVTPLRLDLWLIPLSLVYWRGPQDWTVGMILGFFLIFHHSFGMIYSIAYVLLVFTILAFNFSKDTWKQYLPNAGMMLGGLLINQVFIVSHDITQSINYIKYNIGFLPLDQRSLFWYVPVFMSAAALLLWKSRTQLPQRHVQAGALLILLAIGNLLYFFGRSHENNLINIAACPWFVLFLCIDLIMRRSPQTFAGGFKRILMPLVGAMMVGLIAFFYSGRAVDRIKGQAANLPKIADFFFQPDEGMDFDFKALKTVTRGNPDIIFLSVNNDFRYYYYGDYTPIEPSVLASEIFKVDLMCRLNKKIEQGADIIVPLNELDSLQENIVFLEANYTYKSKDFLYISNNQPAL